MLRAFCIFFLAGVLAENSSENGTYYESLTGQIITWEEFKKHVEDNTTYWCTGNLTACDANEGRRQDGSCNNLKHPTRGTPHTPYYTELPLVFEHGNEPVRLKTGEQLDARKVRMETLPEGIIPDQKFSILLVHYLLFGFGNIGSLHDTVNYVLWRPYCCAEKGKSDPMCYPIKIRSDDQVHQFSDIRCYNNTRPITFQTEGCIRDKKSTPQRLNSATNFFDLPTIYAGGKAVRTMEDGMLRVEEENGKIWPMSMPEELVDGICLLNEKPKETRCHIIGPANSLFGINFLSIIFWRYHNFIAERLKRVNPCWSDEKIFSTAKEINIAQFTQIYFYEMLPHIFGRGNLYREEIISYYEDHRDPYDENLIPQQSIEYHYALRWTHTIQPGHLEMFDGSGNYLRQIPVTNVSFRTGYFPLDNHFEGFTQACFRQAAAKFDNVVDPVISQSGITGVQRAFDITAADLMKGGLFGIQPYIYYREMCTGMRYSKWEDLIRDMEPEYIEMLKKQFKYVQDIPLMAGMWLERKIPGGEVPLTFACINFRQLKRFVQHDRHWYERPNRPNAFSRQQLHQIRRSNIARILCDVGDTITHITPQAFLRESGRNRITSCSNIATIDYRAWRDSSC